MSVEVKTPTHTQFEHSEFLCGDKQSSSKPKPSPVTFKFDENQQNYNSYRRASDGGQNLSVQWKKRKLSTNRNDASFYGPGSRRKRFKSTPSEQIVLPTKFLLGGNINDPLNLNSINEEENDKTPYSSPVPTPAHRKELINSVPFNITDPLNLESADDEIGMRGAKKKKRNKKRHESFSSGSQLAKEWVPSEKRKNLMQALKIEIDEPKLTDMNLTQMKSPQMKELTFKLSSSSKPDKIVSPVIPQSSPRPRKRTRCSSMSDVHARPESTAARAIFRTSLSPSRNLEIPKPLPVKISKKSNQKQSGAVKFNKNPKFVHGNYNRYYGYRNPETEDDYRLHCFKQEWFEKKDVLDIGCNVGHLTLSIARDFNPTKIVGVDIDRTLITAARKNIRHYITSRQTDSKSFPVSNSINYGPILAPPVVGNSPKDGFPYNITFTQGNYVLSSDEMVDQQREEYDVILALSLTKWIHLNNGDIGLKRFFRRIFNHLRPGGRLILEPQPWSSYKKKKKLTEDIHKSFQSIKLKPHQFSDYLLREVGFSTCEVVDVPFNKSKGFRRPIQLYTKADSTWNSPKDILLSGVTNTPSNMEGMHSYEPSSIATPCSSVISVSASNSPKDTPQFSGEQSVGNTPSNLYEHELHSHEPSSTVNTPQSGEISFANTPLDIDENEPSVPTPQSSILNSSRAFSDQGDNSRSSFSNTPSSYIASPLHSQEVVKGINSELVSIEENTSNDIVEPVLDENNENSRTDLESLSKYDSTEK
ncbi:BCDIN3 [Mytilus edulis]|uniref:RNA methyltransferase n=1 Tax=Mytilus edulis TaxID=6550 RepID=A0A8S3PQN3_MYTED|nr:BCDIN3 [Mytilus edulis]